MSIAKQLTPQAQRFIAELQHETGPLTGPVTQAITEAYAAQQAPAPLDLKAAFAAVLQGSGKCIKKDAIEKAVGSCKDAVATYQCDGTNPAFVTQIVGARIEKYFDSVYQPPRPTPPRVRDPLFLQMNLAPDAKAALLFNAQDVDSNGRPLLLKVIVREGVDASKLNLDSYRTKEGWTRDVITVGANQDYVDLKDMHEDEFDFGAPVKLVSLNKAGREISSALHIMRENVRVTQNFHPKTVDGQIVPDDARPIGNPNRNANEAHDSSHVVTFIDRLGIKAELKDGANTDLWGGTPAANFDFEIFAKAGLMFEPNSSAQISVGGTSSMTTQVPADDVELLGSPRVSQKIAPNTPMSTFLAQTVTVTSFTKLANHRPKPDTKNETVTVKDLVFGAEPKMLMGGKALVPMANRLIAARDAIEATETAEAVPAVSVAEAFAEAGISAVKRPLAGDPEQDGQEIQVRLDAGFLAGMGEKSAKGWRIEAGYVDATNKWQSAGEHVISGKKSGKTEFTVKLDDAPEAHRSKRRIEVRVFNDNGIPAQRVLIDLSDINWEA